MGRPRMRIDRVVEAALEILDEDGADALSMRALARRLDSSTATLYRHFPNRAALVGAVIDRVLAEIDVQTRTGPWQQNCHRIATSYFETLRRHRGVSALLADHTPVGPNAAAVTERWLATLLDDGFPVHLAARSGAMISSYVQGFAMQLAGHRAVAGRDEYELPAAARRLDPKDFPATATAIRAGIAPLSLEDEFEFGLQMILGGLERARNVS